jgi:hypothetical protein
MHFKRNCYEELRTSCATDLRAVIRRHVAIVGPTKKAPQAKACNEPPHRKRSASQNANLRKPGQNADPPDRSACTQDKDFGMYCAGMIVWVSKMSKIFGSRINAVALGLRSPSRLTVYDCTKSICVTPRSRERVSVEIVI